MKQIADNIDRHTKGRFSGRSGKISECWYGKYSSFCLFDDIFIAKVTADSFAFLPMNVVHSAEES